MLIYLLLIVFILLLGAIFSKKYKKFFVITVCILLSLVAGLRHYTIGNDTANYRSIYSRTVISHEKVFDTSRMEPGYAALNLIFTNVGADFNVFLFSFALATNIAISWLIFKKSKYPVLSFLLFILFRLFFDEMNIMRQFLSIAIIISGLSYIEKRKLLKYSLIVLLATCIHTSSLFMIVLFFLYRKYFSEKSRVYIYIGTVLMMLFLNGLLTFAISRFGIYGNYVGVYMDSNKLGSVFRFLFAAGAYAYCRFLYARHEREIQDKKQYGFLLNVSLLSVVLSLCAIRISILSRLIEFFNIFLIISIPNFTALIKNKKNRFLAIIVVLLVSVLFFSVITVYRPEWNKVIPYKFFWE